LQAGGGVLRDDAVEPRVRQVVAEQLGVPGDALAPEVSFGDLASDRQSVREMVLAVESRLGVRVESRLLDEVRSYGELVEATIEAIRLQRARLAADGHAAPSGRVRIVGPAERVVERAGALTPYMLEGVVADARRAGSGATVAVIVGDDASDAQVAGIRARLAAAGRLGVTVQIARRPV
jgi:acyl carrier protein